MATHLDRIMAQTALAVARRRGEAHLPELTRRAQAHTPRGFARALRSAAKLHPAIIAEMKKASPSRGLLRARYHPAEIAREYEQAGAAAISVLTDEAFFQGSLDHLQAASDTVTIPILRKDFMLDAFQLLEARAAGADAILLIVAAHADAKLIELAREARGLELDVLCEVHDRDELARAVDLGFEIVGVNSRNLKTLQVESRIHFDLAPELPSSALRVAESGIGTSEDIKRLRAAGYNAFLIGEALMREGDPGATLALWVGRSLPAEAGLGHQ